MDIKLHEITIGELVDGYIDEGESGVFALDENLTIRPPYQREMVYSEAQQVKVIDSVMNDYPINVMYWMIVEKDEDGNPIKFECLDGQQRTLSICHFIDGDYPVMVGGNPKYYNNLSAEEQKQINDYKTMIYFCEGTDDERLEWFKRINISGESLTEQEIRNAVYVGPWTASAKKTFSKSGCYAYNLGSNYLKGDPIRQEYLETVIKWICDRDGVATIEDYMAQHQNDKDASELKKYFTDVIEWIEDIFPDYDSKMKGLDWGTLYNKYHKKKYDKVQLKADAEALMADYEVQKKQNIYEYLLGGKRDEKLLNIRQFDEPTKRKQYATQGGVCPMCGKKFEYDEMHGDHKVPWSKGGKTVPENCQMLCTKCNLQKKAQDASFV